MKLEFDKPHILYACDKCCTKLSRKDEPCHRCHSGRGVQIDPVPKSEEKPGTKLNSDMCSGIRRPRKHSPKTRF